MTYPANPAGTNQWGGWSLPTTGGTPPPTGQLAPPQSPSGSVTNESATWNYANSETSTENYVSAMVAAGQEAVSFNTTEPSPALNVAETTPAAPTNSFVQEGTPAISNTLAISESFAGVAPSNIQVFNFGATGNV